MSTAVSKKPDPGPRTSLRFANYLVRGPVCVLPTGPRTSLRFTPRAGHRTLHKVLLKEEVSFVLKGSCRSIYLVE